MSSCSGRAAPAHTHRNFVLQIGIRLSPPPLILCVLVLLTSPKAWLQNCLLLVAFPHQVHTVPQLIPSEDALPSSFSAPEAAVGRCCHHPIPQP